MDETGLELELPGFRFHPTEEELLDFYLKNMISGKNTYYDIIGFLNIYLYDPWILPELSTIGEREWYFFVPRIKKHGTGARPNRTTKNGFWKATGSDRKIFSLSSSKKLLGLKKTLVFYKGRAPGGTKTDWVMNEYRLPDSCMLHKEMVLCKIYRKATSMKVLEQRASKEEVDPSSPFFSSQHDDLLSVVTPSPMTLCHVKSVNNSSLEIMIDIPDTDNSSNSRLKLPTGTENLSKLQLPQRNIDWNQGTQLRSPWLDNIIFTPSPCANLLNF